MAARTFAIRTFGCQMNSHDSEKVANLLLHAGYAAAAERRERRPPRDQHLLDPGEGRAPALQRPRRAPRVEGAAARAPARRRRLRGAAGGRRRSWRASPRSTSCSGPTTCAWCPSLVARCRGGPARRAQVSTSRASTASTCPSATPPSSSPRRAAPIVTVMEGCDMFCIVLHRADHARARGQPARRRDRARGGVAGGARRARDHAARPDRERLRPPRPAPRPGRAAGTLGFAALIRRLAADPRRRAASATRARIRSSSTTISMRAHGEIEKLCPHVHLPVQSGSDAVLARMRRRYTGDDVPSARRAPARRAPRPRAHDRPDRRLPGRDRRRLRGDPRAGARRRLRRRLLVQVLPAPGHAAAPSCAGRVSEAVAQERLEAVQELLRAPDARVPPRPRRDAHGGAGRRAQPPRAVSSPAATRGTAS